MATSKAFFHARSVSLPSTSHPQDVSTEDHLCRLSAYQASPSSSSISQNLGEIKDLYEQMNKFIHFPHNKNALSNEKVEEVLEGSIALLDTSSLALDAVSQMKESLLDLKSSLRRGMDGEGVHAYLVSRRRITKMVSKYIATLKKANKVSASLEHNDTAIRMLKEAENITLSALKSVLSFVIGKKAMSQTGGWSMVAKLVKSKQAPAKTDEASEVEDVDRTLSFVSKKHPGVECKVLLRQLEALETIIYELENGLGQISRCLVKTRVSLLNILNH